VLHGHAGLPAAHEQKVPHARADDTHEFLLHEHSTSVLMHAVQWGTVYALHMQVAHMYMAA
jgi:hypothetical protein